MEVDLGHERDIARQVGEIVRCVLLAVAELGLACGIRFQWVVSG